LADLVIKEIKKGKILVLEFSGDIDESADFSNLPVSNFNEIIVDADDVKGINSWGVREWTKWAQSLPQSIKFTVKKCPQVMINQINLIAGFLPKGAVIASFYVPYFCNNCGHTSAVLFFPDKTTERSNPLGTEAATCEKCGSQAEWDIVAKTYFRFMDSHKRT
jgi:hypothetical protein